MGEESLTLLKGTLDVLILKALSRGPAHGYAVSRWLRETTDATFVVDEGALYPALRRLEKKAWAEAEWGVSGTGREARFYRLTDAGRVELERRERDWRRYVEAMGRVLEAPSTP